MSAGPGRPAPRIEYSEAEQHVWRLVWRELAPRYERDAIAEFREGVERLGVSRDHVPDLDDVSARLSALRRKPVKRSSGSRWSAAS